MAEGFLMTALRNTSDASIPERQQRLVDEFLLFDSWDERYRYLIELGELLPPLPRPMRADRYRVPACGSATFLAGERQNGRLFLHAASDMPMPARLLAILLRIYSDAPPADILRHPPVLLDRIGLTHRLSPHRRIVLLHIHERLLTLASDHETSGKLVS